jgi:hypothetical protein
MKEFEILSSSLIPLTLALSPKVEGTGIRHVWKMP